ncbi:MAG TPA: excisionase family DNA-binding protein [Mammaliicoccus lentus]|nr:excisionase [Mammaliicoccus lentus]HJF21757.1 excisionase family DNA-binding protein [Mammaliicoccus lentus]
MIKLKRDEVPIWHKANLTINEAAVYSNIGVHKLREITDSENCDFVLWVGNKRLIKREKFDEYLRSIYSI